MKTILFCRVSSREQEETGYSLEAQEKLLSGYTEKKGLLAKKIFSISESASGRKQREIFNNMIAYTRKNDIKIIVCEKVDRLARNMKDAVVMDDWLKEDETREVHFVKENVVITKNSKSHEKFMWNMKVSVAQFYADNLSEEVKKGQKEKIAQGWLPAKPPLGYKNVTVDKHVIQVIDTDKAPLVKKIFELYATGDYSLKRLTEHMFKKKLRTRGGNKLVTGRLHALLRNPYYCGYIEWNGKRYEGKHDKLISKEYFDKVQLVLQGKNTPKGKTHFFLFKGLIRCIECGGVISWETHKDIIYGHCNHYRPCKQSKWVKQHEIDKQVINLLHNLQIRNQRVVEWIRKALKENHKEQIEYQQASLKQLQIRYDQLVSRLDKIYDDKLDGEITAEMYHRKCKQYTEEKEQVVEGIKKHSQENTKYYELGLRFYEIAQRAKEIYMEAVDNDKKQILRLIFASLTLNNGTLNYAHTRAFKILSDVINATNSSKEEKMEQLVARIFEPKKESDTMLQINNFAFFHPELRRGRDLNSR